MKKKNFSGLKTVFVPLLMVLIITAMTGCSFFTNSWGKSFSRDMTDVYSKQSLDKLLELAADPSLQNDKEASKQLLAAIGGKDVSALSAEDKNTILSLTISTSITMDTLAETLSNLENAQDGSTDTVDGIIDGILNSFQNTDLSAFTAVMSNASSVTQLDPVYVCLATVCAATQIAKANDMNTSSDLRQSLVNVVDAANNGSGVDAKIDAAVAVIAPNGENETELRTILEAFTNIDFDNSEIVSGKNLSSLFNTNP